MITLLSHLETLPSEQIVLRAKGRNYQVQELLQFACDFRENFRELESCSIALTCSDVVDFITSIIALDGWSRDIFLAPPSLDKTTLNSLCQQLNCDWLITDDKTSRLKQEKSSDSSPYTQWWLATSGTTDTPKLFGHTLKSLTSTTKLEQLAEPLRWGLVYDFNRFAGLQVVLQAILSGSILVSVENLTHSDRAKVLIEGEVTAISATPSLWRMLLMEDGIEKLKLRQVTIGGEIVDQPLLNMLAATYPEARIVHIYASTEAGVGFAVKDRLAGFPANWLESGSAPVNMRIDDNGHLRIKPTFNPAGEMFIQRLDDDGFFDTEDLVRIINDRVYFLGRASGAINVGGNKVVPEEVEQVILEVPGVKVARVSGKSSSILGQLVVCEIVSEQGYDLEDLKGKIIKHCQDNLDKFKVPTTISFVERLQATTTGKLERQ